MDMRGRCSSGANATGSNRWLCSLCLLSPSPGPDTPDSHPIRFVLTTLAPHAHGVGRKAHRFRTSAAVNVPFTRAPHSRAANINSFGAHKITPRLPVTTTTTTTMARDPFIDGVRLGVETIGEIANLASVPGAGAVAGVLSSAMCSLDQVLVQRVRVSESCSKR
jgi:hypothetical protein